MPSLACGPVFPAFPAFPARPRAFPASSFQPLRRVRFSPLSCPAIASGPPCSVGVGFVSRLTHSLGCRGPEKSVYQFVELAMLKLSSDDIPSHPVGVRDPQLDKALCQDD